LDVLPVNLAPGDADDTLAAEVAPFWKRTEIVLRSSQKFVP